MLSQEQLEIRVRSATATGFAKYSLAIEWQMSGKLFLVHLLTCSKFVCKHYTGINFRAYVLSTNMSCYASFLNLYKS